MNLVLASNPEYRIPAVNLIESYRRHGANGRILYVYFGAMQAQYLEAVQSHYGNQLVLHRLSSTCPHAEDPGMYFFKSYAIHQAARWGEPFLYLDSMSRFHRRPIELEEVLRRRTRAFAPYPPVPFFRNERWTAKACLQWMLCEEERFRSSHQYAAGLQAYLPTPENLGHIDEMFELMHSPEVAGPNSRLERPDGDGPCVQHRNDQSVLSLLIERNGWQQPFDASFFLQYGDVTTVEGWTPGALGALKREIAPAITHRGCPKVFDFAPFVPENLRRRIL